MKKYEGSWMNHVKKGQKKAAKENTAEMELIIPEDIDFDGLGIKSYSNVNNIDEIINELRRRLDKNIANIKTL